MGLNYFSNFKNFIFSAPFRIEEEGKPSTNNNFKGKDGWVVSDPKKSVEYLSSIPENEIENIAYRDTGIIQHFKTKDKEIVFFKAKEYQDNTCRPYSLVRECHSYTCPFCGRKFESLEDIEIYLNDEFVSKMTVCPDCAKLIKEAAEKDDFGKKLVEFVKEFSENWEKGTKDNVKVGSVLKILELRDEPYLLNKNSGVVTYIDDAGQIHGTWSGLAIIPEVDSFLVLKEEKQNEENCN